MRAYVDPGAPGRNWNDATKLVIQGKAGMQIMGDWAKGEFTAAGQTAGKEFGCTILSKEGGYVMGGDVFAFPKSKDPATQKAQLVLAKVMLDPETQIRFSQKKGSIPVRLDLDIEFARHLRPEGGEDAGRQDPSGAGHGVAGAAGVERARWRTDLAVLEYASRRRADAFAAKVAAAAEAAILIPLLSSCGEDCSLENEGG